MRMRQYIEDQKRFCFLGTEMINLGENTYQGGFAYFRNSSWAFTVETLTVICSSNLSEVPPPPRQPLVYTGQQSRVPALMELTSGGRP